MTKGQCLCGAVRFEVNQPVNDIYMCHCSICRRASGVHGMAVVVVKNEGFSWTHGHGAWNEWQKPGADWATRFCRTCGSTLPGENDAQRMFVPVGLLDANNPDLTIKHHIFVDSKAHWFEIGDTGEQHPKAFGSKI